ncbi:hypothetical protein D3C71_811800 [compost metagenome]
MVGAGVDVQLHILAARKGLHDGLARGRRAKTVKLSDVQHQAALDISGFSQRSFYADAVVAHRHVGIGTAGRQVGQLAAQAEAQHTHLAALRADLGARTQRRDGCLQVLQALGFVKALVERKCARHILRCIEFHRRLLAPEKIGYQHHIPFLCVVVGDVTHGAVHSKNFLCKHQPWSAATGGCGEVSAKAAAAAAVCGFEGDPLSWHVRDPCRGY